MNNRLCWRSRGVATAIGGSLLALTAAQAQAQSSASTTVSQDGNQSSSPTTAATAEQGTDIIVTAQKRAESLSNVPLSITALTGAQLVDKGINDVQDLAKLTPGLSFVDSGRSAPVFSLRGVGFFDNALGARPTVSVYADEAPLPFSVESRAPAFDLERVEVLKGPQGTLFGQSSTGGAINYIAAKPTSSFDAGVTASYGRFSRADLQAFVSGPLSSTLNARAAVHTQIGSDWQRSYTRNDTLGRQRFFQGRLLLDWKPSDRLSVAVNLNGFHDGSDNQAPQFIGAFKSRPYTPLLLTYPVAPRDPRAADFRPGVNYVRDNTFYQGVLRADYDVSSALTLTSLTSYSREDVNSLNPDGTTLINFENRDSGFVESVSEELRASGDVGGLRYIVGGSYERARTSEVQETFITYNTVTPIAGDDDGVVARQRFSTVAAFGDLTYELAPHLRLLGGARYTRQSLDYFGCFVTLNAASAATYTRTINGIRAGSGLAPIPTLAVGACASLDANRSPAAGTGNLTEDNVSWRAGLDFKPTQRTLLYATVSKGYKGGSIPAPGASSIEQIRPVRQESVLAYEAGIKTSVLDRVLDITAAGFYYDYTDKQLFGRNVFNPNIFGAQTSLVNIPKSRVIGGEAQVTVRPVTGMTLSAAGTYLDTKLKGSFVNYDLVGTLRDFGGNSFPFTPKWQLVFDGEDRIPVSPSLVGVFGFNTSYRTATAAGFGGDPRLNIDSYWLVDLRLGVEAPNGARKAQLYGRNVTNQYYWSNVIQGGDTLKRYVGMPATYGIQLSVRFR